MCYTAHNNKVTSTLCMKTHTHTYCVHQLLCDFATTSQTRQEQLVSRHTENDTLPLLLRKNEELKIKLLIKFLQFVTVPICHFYSKTYGLITRKQESNTFCGKRNSSVFIISDPGLAYTGVPPDHRRVLLFSYILATALRCF